VAVLGASNKTYAEAFANEQLPAWLRAHCHAFAFFQGVARITVVDYVARHIINLLCPARICAPLLEHLGKWVEVGVSGHIIFIRF